MDKPDSQPTPEGMVRINLDGSYGAGPTAELTIVTKGEGDLQREETFTVPYFVIDTARLQRFNDLNLILGFKLVKGSATPPGFKDLGL